MHAALSGARNVRCPDRPLRPMAATRVMLGMMPAMLRDILETTFAREHDMTLVGKSDARSSLPADVAASRPDVLVVAVDRPELAAGYTGLLVDHPNLHILAIGEDARSAMMQEVYLRRWRVADLSPSAIVAAVRAARPAVEC